MSIDPVETESPNFSESGSVEHLQWGNGDSETESVNFNSDDCHEYEVTVGGGVDWNRTFAAGVCVLGAVLGIMLGWWMRVEMQRTDCSIDVLLSSQAARVVLTLSSENVTIAMTGGTPEEFRAMMQGAASVHSGGATGLWGVYYTNLFPRVFTAAQRSQSLETFCADASVRKQVLKRMVNGKNTGLTVNHVTISDTAVDTVICNHLLYGVEEREAALHRGLSSGPLHAATLVVSIEKVFDVQTIYKLSGSTLYRLVLFGRTTTLGIRELIGVACNNGLVPIGVLETSGRQCQTLVAGVHEYMITLGRQKDARQAARACQQWTVGV